MRVTAIVLLLASALASPAIAAPQLPKPTQHGRSDTLASCDVWGDETNRSGGTRERCEGSGTDEGEVSFEDWERPEQCAVDLPNGGGNGKGWGIPTYNGARPC